MCLARSPECAGTECLAGASCECGGGLACADQPVPDKVDVLFGAACETLRLAGSVVPDDTVPTPARLRTAKATARSARSAMQKTARAARRLVASGDMSPACSRAVLTKVRMVKQAVPRGRDLRRCVFGG